MAKNILNDQPDIIDAHNNILKLKIKKGRETLERITPNDKSLGHYYYVKNLADVVELLLNEDTELYKSYDDREDDYLKEIKKMSDSDPFKLFYTAEIKLMWALVKIQYGDELNGGMNLRSSWSSIQKNISTFPGFNANNKTLGLLHIVFGSMPDNYQWILKLLGIRGNIPKGIEELNMITEMSPFWLETAIIKSVVSVNILNTPQESLAFIEKLLSENPDNIIINYLYNTTLIKYSKSQEALNNLTKLLYLDNDYLFLNLIYYQLGEIYLQKQDYNRARLFYSKFLNDHKGQNFVKDAWCKTAITYWLQNNEKLADVHAEKADDSGRTFVSADKNADEILGEDQLPNKELMKIRLATDGGYFDEAERMFSSLNENMFETKKEKTIYYYRQARLKHKLGEEDKAIYFYLYTIKKAGNENWYYAPYSCLNTGYIYMDKGETEKAKFYFNKTLSYKKHQYKTGIDVKAETALNAIANAQSIK
ncbi:hypothetical protein [Reichenbachiella sp. MALMAid0571]|uniref:tetratricopeptide repeat protein n=1 Tax=Reichenbachiella sp. MALMAid0571 TaxID=3143939 RepID=UPI0032DEB118